VTASWDGTRIWDVATQEIADRVLEEEAAAFCGVFSPDGRSILTASIDKSVRVWDAAPPRASASSTVLSEPGQGYLSPDGKRLVLINGNRAIVLDSVRKNRIGRAMLMGSTCNGCAFSRDGERLVTYCQDGSTRQWYTETGEQIGSIMWQDGSVACAAYSPDGSKVVTGGSDGTARRWDALDGSPIGDPMFHHGSVYYLVISPDGRRLATMTGTLVKLWDIGTGTQIGKNMFVYQKRTEEPAYIQYVTFGKDGSKLLVACYTGEARMWDGFTGKPIGQPIDMVRVWNGKLSPTGESVATYGLDLKVRLWSMRNGLAIGKPISHEGRVHDYRYSPDGSWLITGGQDKTVRLWDAATVEPIGLPLKCDSSIERVFFIDIYTALVLTESGSIWTWDLSSLRNSESAERLALRMTVATHRRMDAAGLLYFIPLAEWRSLADRLAGGKAPQ